MTKAKAKFDKTINRCEDLIKVYQYQKEQQVTDPNVQPSQDILRAAIVLAVAAFDAYATDCFCEKFVNYIKTHKIDGSMESLLKEAGFGIAFALDLIANADRPYRKLRTLIEKHYSKFTTQKLVVIDKLFLQYNLKKFTENAAKKAVSEIGKSHKRLLSSVEKIIERRHGIVHDGDYNDHDRIKAVSDSDINRIKDLKSLVDGMDAIIENALH